MYGLPVTRNFHIPPPWRRELKGQGGQTIVAIYLHIPDNQSVEVGRSNFLSPWRTPPATAKNAGRVVGAGSDRLSIVDEQKWLGGSDLAGMLNLVTDRASERLLRLLACACLRRLCACSPAEPLPAELLLAERFADGHASSRELRQARSRLQPLDTYDSRWAAHEVLRGVVDRNAKRGLRTACNYAHAFFYFHLAEREGTAEAEDQAARDKERACWPLLLRDVLGNPFRAVKLDPAWLTSTVRSLALAVYEERAFDRLPILADALEDAGCTDAAILGHCRSEGVHVRGCWVVDALLAKR